MRVAWMTLIGAECGHRFVGLVAFIIVILLLTSCYEREATDAKDSVSNSVSTSARATVISSASVPHDFTTVPSLPKRVIGAPVPPLDLKSVQFSSNKLNLQSMVGRFPSLDRPSVVSAREATWLNQDDLVLGAVQNGESRAYPLFMMAFHHVANDDLGGKPYLVTF